MKLPSFSRATRVWRRNGLIFTKRWQKVVLAELVNPLVLLAGLGLGLGTYVNAIEGQSYSDFVAPALCAYAVLIAASGESTYVFSWKLNKLKTYTNVLATPMAPEDVILGEGLWATTRALVHGLCFLAVIAALGFVHSFWALLLPVPLAAGAFLFASAGLWFSLSVRSIDALELYAALVVAPLVFCGGIFYSFANLPEWAQKASWFLPTMHLVRLTRSLADGTPGWVSAGDLAWLLVVGLALFVAPLLMFRRRVIG
jgi:lipooligosaccharide transport system permease protein